MNRSSKKQGAHHTPSHPYTRPGPDGMAEWSRRETSEPGVPCSNPPQVSDCPTILPGLGGYPGRPI